MESLKPYLEFLLFPIIYLYRWARKVILTLKGEWKRGILLLFIIPSFSFSWGTSPNHDPDAVDDTITINVNTSTIIDVLDNDSDSDGDDLSIDSTTEPAHGSVSIIDNTLMYTPDADYVGSDTFDYTISDGNGGSDTATVTVTIEAEGTPPAFENLYSCGIFGSVLVSYEHITMGQNDVYNACEISVKGLEENFDEDSSGVDVTCYTGGEGSSKCSCIDTEDTDCSNDGTCTIVPEPVNRYSHTFIPTSDTTSTSTSNNIEFSELEYGNYTFTGNSGDNQQIYFNPQISYRDNDTKVMLLGNFEFSGNDQTLTFEAGDYYFNSFKIDQDSSGNINQVNICAKDDIRIFVHEDFVYSGNHLNDAGCGGKIFVYVEGDATVDSNGGGSSDIPLFLYTEGDVKIEPSGDASEWVGAITAEGEIDISKGNSTSNFNFYYDDSADDFGLGECQMCYTDIYVSGFSFSMGDCPGFSFSVFSDIKVPIEASDPLTNVTVNEAHTGSAFSFSLMDNQEVIDQDGNHVRDAESDSSSVLNAGAFGMDVSLFQDEVITYPLGDDNGNYGPTDSNDYQQLHSSTLFGFDMCEWAESLVYVAHYDDGGKHYDSILSKCTSDDNSSGTHIGGLFDAWDTFRDNVSVPPTDRNISTKVVSDGFKLSLASLNVENNAYETKKGIGQIEVAIYRYPEHTAISNSIEFDVNTVAHISESAEFTVNQAVKNAVVGFRLCATYDETGNYFLYPSTSCSGDNQDCKAITTKNNPTWHICYSSDNFAIRPKEFTFVSAPTSEKAGNTFNIIVKALDEDGNPSLGYNETVNIASLTSPSLNYKESNTNCLTGNIEMNNVNFTDGEANLTLQYNEVGSLDLQILEIQGSEFAQLDNDDTDFNTTVSDSGNHEGEIYRQIDTDTLNITFIPDHFQLANIVLHDKHEAPDINFTYLASQDTHDQLDQEMSATLDIDILASTEQNTTTTNYNSVCGYAKTLTNLILGYKIDTKDSNTYPNGIEKILYRVYDDGSNEYVGSADFAETVTISNISNLVFNTDHNGTAKLKVQLNFNRKYNSPVNPFILSITDINISDTQGITDINNSAKPEHTATFLYARVRPSQYLYDNVVTQSINTPIMVQVYCDRWPASATNCPTINLNGQTNEYQWWLSTEHNSNDGDITLSTTTGEIEPTNISFISNGTNNNIKVSGNIGETVDISFDTTNSNNWLIFNQDSDSVPLPFYRVKFIGESGWTGEGKTGYIIDDDINSKKIRRLEW